MSCRSAHQLPNLCRYGPLRSSADCVSPRALLAVGRCCQLCFALRYAVTRLLLLLLSPSTSYLLSSHSESKQATESDTSSSVSVMVDVTLLGCCVLLPSTLSLTALSGHVPLCMAALLCLVVLVCLLSLLLRPAVRVSSSAVLPLSSSSTAFVSLYRCGLLLSTAAAILGVDFVVFPRRLAKTEQFGVSPMDAGVGGFMFAAALTSPAVRRSATVSYTQTSLAVTVRRQLPVLLLGGARLLAVKWANYQEHVTEYGVHWNFFFTLALGQSATHTQHTQLATLLLLTAVTCHLSVRAAQ